MSQVEQTAPEVENQSHTYVTHKIPWYIHLLWIGFWVLAMWYVLAYQLPIIPKEIATPP